MLGSTKPCTIRAQLKPQPLFSPTPAQRAVPSTLAALLVLVSPPCQAAEPVGLHLETSGSEGRLLPCAPKTSCVSSANFLSPSQYLAPWSFDPKTPAAAKRQLLDELVGARGGRVVAEDEGRSYVALMVPYKLGAGKTDVDLLEFKFTDVAVAFRSEAGVNIPPPPFCYTPGCISGPPNRARMEVLRDALGWSSQETDEDKKWVQILLHN
ncbi:hypothetical protein HYH02_001304 [Chlamydomonas schloesseri]|uniref:Uncharacterized protein n=1 Tax=Chlamydomonas schloesseri TaxID=2026947 RepID=A0A835WU40_9CHLO|nr:hypothetical protein HYH02_001304 [Chlamydomonas schloesseri]|eukprot:KAG2454273.1 hypothetical protein HYH02_001304 [Chlamydomonas schloesseri]